jgi:hypothetical protein
MFDPPSCGLGTETMDLPIPGILEPGHGPFPFKVGHGSSSISNLSLALQEHYNSVMFDFSHYLRLFINRLSGFLGRA